MGVKHVAVCLVLIVSAGSLEASVHSATSGAHAVEDGSGEGSNAHVQPSSSSANESKLVKIIGRLVGALRRRRKGQSAAVAGADEKVLPQTPLADVGYPHSYGIEEDASGVDIGVEPPVSEEAPVPSQTEVEGGEDIDTTTADGGEELAELREAFARLGEVLSRVLSSEILEGAHDLGRGLRYIEEGVTRSEKHLANAHGEARDGIEEALHGHLGALHRLSAEISQGLEAYAEVVRGQAGRLISMVEQGSNRLVQEVLATSDVMKVAALQGIDALSRKAAAVRGAIAAGYGEGGPQ